MNDLIVEIKTKDDKVRNYICNDFPGIGDFITLYQKGFKRILIDRQSVSEIKYYFRNAR